MSDRRKNKTVYFKLKTSDDCDQMIEYIIATADKGLTVVGVDCGMTETVSSRAAEYADIVIKNEKNTL